MHDDTWSGSTCQITFQFINKSLEIRPGRSVKTAGRLPPITHYCDAYVPDEFGTTNLGIFKVLHIVPFGCRFFGCTESLGLLRFFVNRGDCSSESAIVIVVKLQ